MDDIDASSSSEGEYNATGPAGNTRSRKVRKGPGEQLSAKEIHRREAEATRRAATQTGTQAARILTEERQKNERQQQAAEARIAELERVVELKRQNLKDLKHYKQRLTDAEAELTRPRANVTERRCLTPQEIAKIDEMYENDPCEDIESLVNKARHMAINNFE